MQPAATSKLLASCPVIDVVMGGISVTCLVDTGSMVSTITESCFQEHFASLGHDRLQSCHWLQLQAANGLSIPYIGYLELDVKLSDKVLPHCGILVVRNPTNAGSFVPGNLGMNIIKRTYQELFGAHGGSFFDLPSVIQSPGPVVEALQQFHQAAAKSLAPLTGAVRVRALEQ